MLPNWTVPNNYKLAQLEENTIVSIALPLSTLEQVDTTIISGSLPVGLRLENNYILGIPAKVDRTIVSTFVIRAVTTQGIADRTFLISVEGADDPQWITSEGRLPVGPNGVFFILDNSLIDFQLLADDPDLPEGSSLQFKLTGGELPPGIRLTDSGKLIGIVDPLLALEINVVDGNYDTLPHDILPYDFGFGLDPNDRIPRKLNREYFFKVTVSDNVSSVTRQFQIFVVGDDFARADNTIMKAADGVFTADFTFLRVPLWLTPTDLGIKRANNYLTIFLDTFDPNTLTGKIQYFLESVNDDGTVSVVPPGLSLDSRTGELAGRVPYQPAVTRNYKFTVNAVRFNAELGLFTVFGTFLDDVIANKTKTLRIGKVPRTRFEGLTELQRLVNRTITIENQVYTVISTNETNSEFDTITLDRVISSLSGVAPLKSNRQPFDDFVFEKDEFGNDQIPDVITQNDFFFVDRLTQSDRNFYFKRNLKYNDIESYTIDEIYPYIKWEISSGSNEFLYLIGNHDSSLIETALESIFSNSARNAYVNVERNSFGQAINIKLIIPATAQNRNKTYIESLFEAADSGPVNAVTVLEVDRIKLDQPISNNLGSDINFGTPIALSLVRGSNFSKTFSQLEEEVASARKTFTIKLLGKVDSVITWLTPTNLGALPANRISTLFVRAQTTVQDSLITYSITQGSLPPGLTLSQDGEIIGKVPVIGTETEPGLIRFIDNELLTTFDFGSTTFDREYQFTILAKDRFKYSAIERTFTIQISDKDNLNYSNIFFRPFLSSKQRGEFSNFVDNARIFTPDAIYRPGDTNFGIQKTLRCLVYAGIENLELENYVAAVAKNHKRKKFYPGTLKTAIAKLPGTDQILYEIVYVELEDRAQSAQGLSDKLQIISDNRITIDSVNFENNDNSLLPIRYRPNGNTIKADNNAITLDQNSDNIRYLSNIDAMRRQIKHTSAGNRQAITNRDFLPLWMRTPQENSLSELGYVLALPIVYTKPGKSQAIKENIENANFDFNSLDFDVDRYIVDSTKNINQEQYILFANYQFNV